MPLEILNPFYFQGNGVYHVQIPSMYFIAKKSQE